MPTKTTNKPCFSNATEMMWWQDSNCLKGCTKYTEYNAKLGRYPKFRCAVQRDYEGQAVGIEEISQRSFDACQQAKCPYFVSKDKPRETIGKHSIVKPAPLFEQTQAVNIQEEAEKIREERIAKAEEMEKAKKLEDALKAAEQRQQKRTQEIHKQKRVLTPEVQRNLRAKGEAMKQELDRIIAVQLSSYHIMVLAMLDIGDGMMQDAIREVKRLGKFKHAIKHQINLVLTEYRRVTAKLEEYTNDIKQTRSDTLDALNELVEDDITKLQFSIKQVLDKANTPNSKLMSLIIGANVMFDLAVQHADLIQKHTISMVAEVFRKEKLAIPKCLLEATESYFYGKKPDGIYKQWHKVLVLTQPSVFSLSGQLTGDKNIKICINVIYKKLSSLEEMEKASEIAVNNNLEAVEKFKQKHPEWAKVI